MNPVATRLHHDIPLAIIGIGCLFPSLGDCLEAFWANITNKVDSIREVPSSHWHSQDYHDPNPRAPDRVYTYRGAFLEPVPFHPADFGIAPNDLEAIDTSQLLALVAAQQALADAGYPIDSSQIRDRVSVILGVTGTLELVIPLGARLGHPVWRRALREAGVNGEVAEDVVRRIADAYVPWQENSFPGLLGNVVAGRIANRFNLKGTNCVVDAACASSFSALHLAALELTTGRSDMVLTGGVDTFNDIFMFTCFSKTPALSPTGDARPFDADGDGTILGEGLGMIVLKRLEDARRDGDRVYAILRGIGSSSDGKGDAVYAPRKEGQIAALSAAYERAGVTPDTIELVEAHGTGTRVGDAVEVSALTEVYQSVGCEEGGRSTGPWCALGSVKSQIGHTKAAAGAAGLIKVVAALYHKVLPPTLKVRAPLEPLASGETPFYVNTEKRPWLSSPEHPRRAAVSAFGFGGSNFHCVVEEADPVKKHVDWDGEVQILAWSAPTREELIEEVNRLPLDEDWRGLSRRAAILRSAFSLKANCRLVLVVHRREGNLRRLVEQTRVLLNAPGGKHRRGPDGIFYGEGTPSGGLAILFPGQGSQYPGMLRDLACRFPQMLAVLEEARRTFPGGLGDTPPNSSPENQSPFEAGEELHDLLYPRGLFTEAQEQSAREKLRRTQIAQPALGAVSLGAWRVLQSFGVQADAFAGHSFGELTALCAAGRVNESDFHTLANVRGKLMAQADAGAMLVVHADESTVRAFLAEANLDLVLANRNAPRQQVLSGRADLIERAATLLSGKQLRCQQLPVGGAFHSPLVADAQAPFRAALDGMNVLPGLPVYANSSASPYPDEADDLRGLLGGQLARPVEFVGQIERMHADGLGTFLEVGPGARLTGLVASILEGRDADPFALDASSAKRSGNYDLACCLAWLASRGHVVDLTRWEARPESALPADRNGKSLVIPICGANYVKQRPGRPPARPVENHVVPQSPDRTLVVQQTPIEVRSTPPAPLSPQPTPTRNVDRAPQQTKRTQPMDGSSRAPQTDTAPLNQALQLTRESLAALQKMQEQTAQLHRQFLEGQESAQRTVHLLIQQQQQLFGMAPANGRAEPVPFQVQGENVSVPRQTEQVPVEVGTEQVPVEVGTEQVRVEVGTEQVPFYNPPSPATPVAEESFRREASVHPNGVKSSHIESVLLEVVSDKTGYPAEMLELDMALDSDLGIDSIKRVEILSALQDRLPGAPVIRPEHLGTLHNLRQIAAFLANGHDDNHRPGQPVSPVPPSEKIYPGQPAAERSKQAIESALLEVVSDKTGYPAEMLELDMALDSDLGIDSIKRVEILSALQDRLPGAPVIRPEHLGTLHNLRQIAAFLANGHDDNHSESWTVDRGPWSVKSSQPVSSRSTVHGPRTTRFEVRPVAITQERSLLALPAGSLVWIASEKDELARLLADRFELHGLTTRCLSLTDAPTLPVPEELAGLVILAPSSEASAEFLEDALFTVQRLGQALRKSAARGTAFLASISRLDGAFGMSGLDPEREPIDGGLAGMIKTVAREWPEVACKAIDLADDHDDPASAVGQLAREILTAGPVEVGLSRSGTCSLELVPEPAPFGSGDIPLSPGEVVVISGGARGVTAEVAVALARACRPTIVLLGRTPLDQREPDWLAGLETEAEIKRAFTRHENGSASLKEIGERVRHVLAQREIRQTLARLEAVGVRADYRAADVRDANAVAGILRVIQNEFGPVRGLIHGAGVLADALVEDKTPEQFRRVYATKVDGLRALLNGIEQEELRLLVLFSSTTARLGRRGQVDYAIANEVLNKFAQRQARRHPACKVVSINWGPWAGGMVTPSLAQIFEQEGVGLIPLEEGAAWLVHEISQPHAPVEVIALGSSSPPPLPPSSPPPLLSVALERRLNVHNCVVLQSHVFDGRPVLPVALMLEWFGQAALQQNPGLTFHGVNDLRVLRGVTFEEGSLHLRVRAGKAERGDGAYRVPVELHTATHHGETLHARAEVQLVDALPHPPATSEGPNLSEYGRTLAEVYQTLFHGPQLQGIEQVLGCGPEGIEGMIATAPPPASWFADPWRGRWLTDPLVLDGSFQLVILWTRQERGMLSLPCKVGSYRQYRRAFRGDAVRAVVRVRRATSMQAVCDIDYVDQEGQLIARLEHHESTLDPALDRVFERNDLSTTSATT